jgi:transcription elongation factor GreA-like protein
MILFIAETFLCLKDIDFMKAEYLATGATFLPEIEWSAFSKKAVKQILKNKTPVFSDQGFNTVVEIDFYILIPPDFLGASSFS